MARLIVTTIFGLALSCSCAKVPVEFKINQELELTEQDVENITDRIKAKLRNIDFSHPEDSPPGMIDPEICRQAYWVWLDKKFEEGFVPKKVIGPEEYAESSTDPLIMQCKRIDFGTTYQVSAEPIMKDATAAIVHFSMEETKKTVSENRCLRSFIDPEKGKMAIKYMALRIRRNTLNVTSPSYTIYSSDRAMTEAEIQSKSESQLLSDGIFMTLAHSEPVPERFTGTVPITPVVNQEAFSRASLPIRSLTGAIIAYPNFLDFRPQTQNVFGQISYIVPKGGIKADILIAFDFLVSLKDAWCSYDEFLEEIKKKEAQNSGR